MKLVSPHYFYALDLDKTLDRCSRCCHLCSSLEKVPSTSLAVEVGRVRNPNMNPVAGKCVAELGDALLRILLKVVQSLPSPLISTPVSVTEDCPLADLQVVRRQHSLRLSSHPASERSKASRCCPHPAMPVQVSDLVNVTSDGSKIHARNRYLVVSVDGLWCSLRTFTGLKLRSTSYRVKLPECYRVPDLTEITSNLSRCYSTDFYSDDSEKEPPTSGYVDE